MKKHKSPFDHTGKGPMPYKPVQMPKVPRK